LKKLPKTKLSILLAEIDGLERIRIEHGASAAAIVARVAAQIFKANLRDIDVVSRLEDNTFSLVLPGIQAADALEIANRMQLAVSRYPLPKRAGVTRMSVAIGAAEASSSDDMQAVLRRSRRALETAMQCANPRLAGIDAQDQPVRLEPVES
jgi:diguanylate cyclase (GGDEF)-like protein